MKNSIKYFLFIIITVIIIIITANFILKHVIYRKKYMDIISNSSKENFIDPYLVLSIIKAESNFNNMAISKKEAYGLMQILFSTAQEVNGKIGLVDVLEISNMLDPYINIKIGVNYISNLIRYYNGNYHLALCAYNAGCGNVDKWIREGIISYDFSYDQINLIPFNETKIYLKNIIRNYRMYKILY